jgi:MoaA/NifB/PqqE/SkfB family radical SAM enzyme
MCEEHSEYSPLKHQRKANRQPHRQMPIELIEKVVTEAVPLGLKEIIPSTMGEPLLYPHFERILELCSYHDVKLNLTTNGTFPRFGAEAWAQRIVPVTSDVKISWNGASKETQESIMKGVQWEAVVDNVRKFIDVRDRYYATHGDYCRVTFQMTFLESNVEELADIVRLAVSLGVDRLKGHHLWAHFEQISELSMRRNPVAIERWNHSITKAMAVAEERPLANGKHILLENFYPLEQQTTQDMFPAGSCPFLGKEAWVSAAGRFDPCCAPDAQRRSLGEFGNLHEQELTAIWLGDAYQGLLDNYQSLPLCRSCTMRKPVESVA